MDSNLLLYILGSTFLISLVGFVGIFIIQKNVKKLANMLIFFAGGALISGAFLHLLPESIANLEGETAFLIVTFSFCFFLIMDTLLHWHFCTKCEIHPFTYTMLVGDAIHNIIDGLIIAAAFFLSIPLGITTTLAIFAHEFPQQLGIFSVLIHGGFDKKKSIIYSYLAQSTVMIGGIIGFLLAGTQSIAYMLMPFAAGGFIYIAASDLVPEMHKEKNKLIPFLIFFAGIVFMYALVLFE